MTDTASTLRTLNYGDRFSFAEREAMTAKHGKAADIAMKRVNESRDNIRRKAAALRARLDRIEHEAAHDLYNTDDLGHDPGDLIAAMSAHREAWNLLAALLDREDAQALRIRA